MLNIPFRNVNIDQFIDYSTASIMFDRVAPQSLAHANWSEEYPYRPSVSFRMLHGTSHFFLQFDVEEEFLRAQATKHNEAVWKDSCVECFLSFDNRETYYNIEFNILGTGLIGYGSADRKARKRLDIGQVERIATFSQITNVGNNKRWQMILIIPKDIFGSNENLLSRGKVFANFYKCGDELPQPHFISWKPIDSPSPNFHQPEFFGEIHFE
ncbi:carbohydrate-binding family 9-like protein [Sphingobacterium corticis]|uniref:Carbohydrate-binding family 9-like protein n=1 Tax=Sphingobacterium corticis TaxID=1812823 RepID=A0ABW5NKS0_9SPHI